MASRTLTTAQIKQFRGNVTTALAGARGRVGVFHNRCVATSPSRTAFWVPLHSALYGQYLAQGGKPGDWQSFLQWILDHKEEIAAFIKMIMALFSGL